MPKPATSQWDFGNELFPKESLRRVFSVSELTTEVRRLLEKHLGHLWVSGEIANYRAQSSGHVYFTLKDAAAQLNCVVFRNDPVAGRESLRDGQKVILQGDLTVYEARGQYQLHVVAVEAQGIGALQAAFEKLKQRLAAEGLFDPGHKRPLPRFPQNIGLVTSPTGAALRDVLHVAQRRNPALHLILAPSAVQGAGAASEIAAAIALLNQWARIPGQALDLILLTRGGGSLEDLWAFNEEIVARAIFNSALPVVSAVGHEIDFTISDFVADLRAATPSAAAEILTEDVFSSWKWLAVAREHIQEAARRRVEAEQRHLSQVSLRWQAAHPRRQMQRRFQRLDDLQTMLSRRLRQDLEKRRLAAGNLRLRLSRLRPKRVWAQRRDLLGQSRRRLREHLDRQLRALSLRCGSLSARLRLLGPQQVLARGYSITLDAASGRIIRAARETLPGQILRTKLNEGEIRSTVTTE